MSRKRFTPYFAAIAVVALTFGLARDSTRVQFPEVSAVVRTLRPVLDPFLVDLEERTFRFFWDTANRQNGLVPDRFPTPSFASIAAVGFGLTAYPIGVERRYITREAARQRVLTTLRFFRNAPQNTNARGATGYKGFFYHFLDMKTGERFEESELSTVDTALFIAGALFCQSYFDGPSAEEVEIRDLVEEIYRRVDWQWAQVRPPAINHGWTPVDGFMEYDWRGYNEAMLLYIMALGSPTFPVNADAWTEWTSTYDKNWRKDFGQEYLGFATALRASIQPRMARLARYPGCVHAQARARLLREQSSRRLRPASLRGRQSAALQGLWDDHLGHYRQRRSRRRRGRGRQRTTNISQLYRSRDRRRRHARRLHPCADGGGGVNPVCARSRDSGGARHAQALWPVHLFDVRVSGRVQFELSF